MRAWKDDLNFRELVMNDAEITSRVPPKQIEQAFSIERQLRNVDKIFKRVFGNNYRG
jgi:adenylosuccinate lyase